MSNILTFFSTIKKKYFRTKTQVYFKTLGLFLSLFFLALLQGFMSRPSNEFAETKMFEPVIFNTAQLTVTKKEYLVKDNVYRLDLFIESSNTNYNDFTPELTANVVTQSNTTDSISTEVLPISDRYFVLFVKNVPSDYGALRFDLEYKKTDDASNVGNARVYVSPQETAKVKERYEQYSKNDLRISLLENDLRLQSNRIENLKKENTNISKQIRTKRAKISELTEEMDYQVGEELTDTEKTVSRLETEIESSERSIENNLITIEETDEKIELIHTKINEISD